MKAAKRKKRSRKRRPAAQSRGRRRQTRKRTRAKARAKQTTRRPAVRGKTRPRKPRRAVKSAAARVVAKRRPSPKRPKPKPGARRRSAAARAASSRRSTAPVRPALDRSRRQLPEDERLPDKLVIEDRMMSAARTGHNELRANIERHTETGPQLTAGDVDAKWEDAYAVGDEAPGGDNPTPDQDRVDDIGKALGVNYEQGEELKGSDKIAERDRHRWELDPASSDDWPHKD